MREEVDAQVQGRSRLSVFPGGSHRSAQHAGCCHVHLETPHAAFLLDWDHAYPRVMHVSLGVGCLKVSPGLGLPGHQGLPPL